MFPGPYPAKVIRLRHRGAKRKQEELVKYAAKLMSKIGHVLSKMRPDNAILEPDNAILEPDNAILEPDNAILEQDNAILEPDNAILELGSLPHDNDGPDVNGPSGETSYQNSDDERQPGASVTHTPFDNSSSEETSDKNPDDEGQRSLFQTPNADSSSNEMSEKKINRTRLLLRHPTRRQTDLLRHLPKYTYTKGFH